MITQEQYQEALQIVLQYRQQLLQEADYIQSISKSSTTRIINWDISTRLKNVIKTMLDHNGVDWRIATIYDLTKFRINDFQRVRTAGKATITELVQKLDDVGLKLMP